MTQRFETKIEEALVRLKAGCEKKNRDVQKVERQIDLASERGSRAGSYFRVLHRLHAVEEAWILFLLFSQPNFSGKEHADCDQGTHEESAGFEYSH